VAGSLTLGQTLLARGSISPDQLAWAEQNAEGQPGGMAGLLLSAGLISEAELVAAAAERLGLPFVDLAASPVDRNATRRLPEALARERHVVIVASDRIGVAVAMADPTDAATLAVLQREVGAPVHPFAAVPTDIDATIDRLYGTAGPAEGHPVPPGPPPLGRGAHGPTALEVLLEEVILREGSDLHLSVGRPPGIRVHGEILSLDAAALEGDDIAGLVLPLLSEEQQRRFTEDLELDTSITAADVGRFRVNLFVQRGCVGAVLRAIPFQIPEFGSLGLPPAVADLANLHRGLVLVTGPTGSGKSTTLASLVDIVNQTRRAHIMTVEDPIEFVHTHKQSVVNQREVGQDTRSFAAALKHVLRQDPDVILVGEMRDLETIATALTAAETGHLVFGTLHTQSAPQSVDRIIDVFPAHQQQQVRTQLSTTLRGVVSQQLIPSRKGRAVAAEVLIATSAVRALIRDGKTHQITSTMQSGGKFGMQTMDTCLARLVRDGVVSLEVATEHCHEEEDFRRLLGGGGTQMSAPTPVTGRR